MSRKSRFILAAIIVCLILAACSVKQSGNPIQPNGPAPVGNMQKNVPSGNFVSAGDKIIFTGTDENTGEIQLLTCDPDTGSVNPFCKDATCSHNSSSCATGGVVSNLESWNGEIYGSDSAGRVLKLKNGRFETLIDGGASHFFHYGNDLYVATRDSSLIVYEGNSKKPRTLVEEYTGYWETIHGDYLYYQSGGVNRLNISADGAQPEELIENAVRITDGQHIYYCRYDDFLLFRCNMDGSNPRQLTDKPVLVASWNFDDEYFYFRYYIDSDIEGIQSGEIYRMLKEDPSKTEKLAELPVPIYQIFTGPDCDLLFVTSYGDGADVYTVSKTGGETTCLSVD